ncbi:MAG: hypothetical protein QXE81_06390 [Desulfurococcaceae archaeon]
MKRSIKYFIFEVVSSTGLASTLIALLLYLVILKLYEFLNPLVVVVSLIAVIIVSVIPFSKHVESKYHKLMLNKFILSGRGLSTRKIKIVLETTRIIIVVLIANTSLLVTVGSPSVCVIGLINLLLLLLLIIILLAPIMLIQLWISQRRTNSEVEIPYIIVLLRVLSTLKIPLYQMLQVLENSACLSAFPRELSLARKISAVSSKSLITTLQEITNKHPSRLVRDLLSRIFNSASSIGDVKEIIDGVFANVFQWYESRILSLTDKFTMITGTAIFIYFFIPLIASSIIPIFIGNYTYFSLIPIIGAQILAFLILHGLISKVYPSSLIIKPAKSLFVLGSLIITLNISLIIAQVLLIVNRVIVLKYEYLFIVQITTFTPMLFITERFLSTRNFYDKFIEVASDALNLSASTGENPVTTLIETANKYGKKMLFFTRALVNSYVSESLRASFIKRAPTLYHASFIESLIIIFEHGWTIDSIKGLTLYYGKLRPLIDRLKGFSTTLEYILISLASLMGGFLEYMRKIYLSITELYSEPLGFTYQSATIRVDPVLFHGLDCIILLSFIMVSMVIGKTRGGSVMYMFRSALLMLVIYTVSKIIIDTLLS